MLKCAAASREDHLCCRPSSARQELKTNFFDRELWKSLASTLEVPGCEPLSLTPFPPRNTRRVPLAMSSNDGLARHRQWACEIAERFSGAEVLPVLSTLSSDIDGHVREAALHASRTVSGGM
jgi:hypothetical protein